MARLTTNLLPFYPALAPDDIRWILVDMASAVMPELGEHLGTYALGVLRRRNVEVRLGVSVSEATASEVTFTDGTSVDCTTLVWCAGVTPNPLIGQLGLPTAKGRLDVDLTLSVAGHPEVYAIGDAAAVPDSTKGSDPDSHVVLCPPTAQHAIRQASAVARNIAASLGRGNQPALSSRRPLRPSRVAAPSPRRARLGAQRDTPTTSRSDCSAETLG